MARGIFAKLALTNLKNNRKTYFPYVLTSMLTVMMYYIMDALYESPDILGGRVQEILQFATPVITVFAIIFLFYTNSFLIKRRKKEIGVYHVLGMGKRHIAKMFLMETLITTAVSIVGGLLAGIIFSKLSYLGLLKILHFEVGLTFSISVSSIGKTVILFIVIFSMTLIYNLLQIRLSNTMELLLGGKKGEKEPKTKWLMTIFGVAALAVAYYIALTTESPMDALMKFFVAVILVILGTYALFVAGSVAFLKILRKNKKFYYNSKHFTAVSGMIYRMKQNAVGLANICILSTMVLVMISTTVCLYMGMEDILNTRFPLDYAIESVGGTDEWDDRLDEIVEEECEKAQVTRSKDFRYHYGSIVGKKTGSEFDLRESGNYSPNEIESIYSITIASVGEYNRVEQTNETLSDGEVLVFGGKEVYDADAITLGEHTYRVKKAGKECTLGEETFQGSMPSYCVILPELSDVSEILAYVQEESLKTSKMRPEWIRRITSLRYRIGLDMEGDEEDCKEARKVIKERIGSEFGTFDTEHDIIIESREDSKASFFELYGVLFFIGIYLGALFLMATVLIIYYKQISEGYDDRERYQIMQNVGMSKREVKRSIRSQVLMVFFLPLLVAGLHIAMAFPIITKLMKAFNMTNTHLFAGCTLATVGVFAVFYGIVYAVTAREYYRIVN